MYFELVLLKLDDLILSYVHRKKDIIDHWVLFQSIFFRGWAILDDFYVEQIFQQEQFPTLTPSFSLAVRPYHPQVTNC